MNESLKDQSKSVVTGATRRKSTRVTSMKAKNILNLTVSVLWILDVMLCVSFVVLDKQSGSVHTELLAITIALAMQKMGRISIVSDDR